MNDVKLVVAISPVFRESETMLRLFLAELVRVRLQLTGSGVEFRHYFLDDGANLPPEDCLIRHSKNQGLAKTLMDGYQAVLAMDPLPDVVIRLDCQEHDPAMILPIIEAFKYSAIQAMFLPVYYWVQGQDRPPMVSITQDIVKFTRALSAVDQARIIEVYNQKFPLGYQAFGGHALKDIYRLLEKGVDIYRAKYGEPTWGLDLLAMIAAAWQYPGQIDFLFGGWMEPWKENISPEKIQSQREKAVKMIEIARAVGCERLDP